MFGSGFCHLCRFWKIGFAATYGLHCLQCSKFFFGSVGAWRGVRLEVTAIIRDLFFAKAQCQQI